MDESNSVFVRTLDDSVPKFAKTCSDLVSNCKETTDETFLKFIKSYCFQDSDFENSIYACGSIGSAKPIQTFTSLINSFPTIDLNDTSEPTNSTSFNFIHVLSNQIRNKWNNKYTRSCVLYTIYYIISKICKILCEKSRKTISEKEAISLIQYIKSWVLIPPSDPLEGQIKMIIIDNFKSALCFISEKCPSSTYDIANSLFSRIAGQDKFIAPLTLKLFSEVYIEFRDKSHFADIFTSLWELYTKNEFIQETAACLLNITGLALTQFSAIRKSANIAKIFEGALSYSDTNSFELAAMVAGFSETSQLNISLLSFLENNLLTSENIENKRYDQILRALTRFLYSANYVPLSIQKIKHMQYTWRFPESQNQSMIDTFHKLTKYPEIFTKSSSAIVADFILQISCNNMTIFNNVISVYMKDKNTMQEAACITFLRMLSSDTKFMKKARINQDQLQEIESQISEEAYKLCKRFLNTISDDANPVIYLTPSFTTELKFTSSPMNDSKQEIHKILTNDMNITPNVENYIQPRILIAINNWKKNHPLFKENLESVKFQEGDSIKKTNLADFKKSYENNRTLIRALHLAPIVMSHNKLLKWVCAKIINREPAVGATAVRALQATLHLNINNTPNVIDELYELIENCNVNTYSLFSIISALKSIMEVVAYEEYQMPTNASLKIIYMLSLGLLCPYYLTRSYALDCINLIPHNKVHTFFSKLDDIITARGKELAFGVMSPKSDDLDSLSIIEFNIIARSDSQYLYSFYIIALFESIKSQTMNDFDKKTGMKKSLSTPDIDCAANPIGLHLRSFFSNILAKVENDTNKDPYFIINLTAALFALGFNNDQSSVIDSLIQRVKKLEISEKKDWICSITSNLSISLLTLELVRILPHRALSLYLMRAVKNAKFLEESSTKYLEAIQSGYQKFIHHIFKEKIISQEATFTIDNNEKLTATHQVALYAFGTAFTTIFNTIAVKQTGFIKERCGIFPRNPIVFTLSDSIFTSNESYAFWFNLSSASNEYYSLSCQLAYAELVKIMTIPDIWFELVSNNIDTIVMNTPDIATTLLTNYPGVLMPLYVQNAPISFTFFNAIAKQLCTVDDFFNKWIKCVSILFSNDKPHNGTNDSEFQSEPASSQFGVRDAQFRAANTAQRLSNTILRNLGTLQAIATSYLISSDYIQRITAFDFIYVTSISIHLMHADNIIESLSFSKALLSMRESFKANMAQFFSNTAQSLIGLLAENLPFISEQFCFTILTIESIRGNIMLNLTNRPKKEKLGSSDKKESKSSLSILPKATMGHINKQSSIGIRKVTFSSLSANSQSSTNLSFTDMQSNSMSISLSPICNLNRSFSQTIGESIGDKDPLEMLRYYVSFVIPWMKNLHYDTDRIHIFDDCYPSYQMFSMYSFIQSIVKMKCLVNIAPPVTDILYATYNASKEFFLIALVDIYFSLSSDSVWRENCISLITYAYSIDSKSVMNYFMTFFAPKLWYYHQIQASKLYQAFDLNQFFDDIETTTGELSFEEKFDYPTVIKFAVKMILIFYHENPTNVLPYKNLIIVFCALMNHELKELAQDVFKCLLDIEPPGPLKFEKKISFIGPYNFDLFIELVKNSVKSHYICLLKRQHLQTMTPNATQTLPPNNPTLPNSLIQNLIVTSLYWEEEISRYLLRWGLICGDSYIASMALKMFISLGFTADEESVSNALDSIYMIYMTLRDAQISKNRTQRQTITKLIDGDGQPDYLNAYHHIKYLCLLCQHVSNPSVKLIDKILLTSFALLLLPELGKISKDQDIAKSAPTIHFAIGNIYMYRERLKDFKPSELIQSIHQNSNNDDNNKLDIRENLTDVFEGFIYYLISTTLTSTSLKLSEDIILYLLNNHQLSLLLGSKYDCLMAIYIILPYIYELESTKGSESAIDFVEIEDCYEDVAEKHDDESLENFHRASLTFINKHSLSIDFEGILSFYRTIIKIGSVKQANAALNISSLIIQDKLVLKSSQVLSELSHDVISRTEYELQDSKSKYFKLVMKMFNGEVAKPVSKTSSNRIFPKIFIPSSVQDFLSWKPVEVIANNSSESTDKAIKNTETNSNFISEFNENYDNVNSQQNSGEPIQSIEFPDIFKSPKLYPPLFLTDYSLFVSEFMNSLRTVVEQIKVQPYTNWSEEVFRERQNNPRNTDDLYDDVVFEKNRVIFYDDELEGNEKHSLLKNSSKLDEIAVELKKLISNKSDSHKTKNQYTTTIIPEKSTAKYSFVDSNLFCPSLDVINQIGQKEFDQEVYSQLPPIFQ